jgi:hypothetical protein
VAREVSSLEQLDVLGWLLDPLDPEAHLPILERLEFVVPVVGSGISASVGYLSGPDLRTELTDMGRTAGLEDKALELPDPRSVADTLILQGAIERDELLGRVAALYDKPPCATSQTIDALLRLRSRRVVTLNYDRSLEVRAEELGIEYESLVLSLDAARVLELLAADAERERLVVIHAHGVASDPTTIVLDAQGYSELISSPYVVNCLHMLMLGNRLLFMGTRLDELHILYELRRFHVLHRRHLLVASDEIVEELQTASRSPLLPGTHSLVIRGYSDHEQLVPLVELLAQPLGAAEVGPVMVGSTFATTSDVPPEDYVETLMLERREVDGDDLFASYLVGLGESAPVPLERMAVIGARTLIEGLPGSGKSTLLSEIGSRQPERVVALRLRATRLDLVGDAQLLLTRWLETAEAFKPGESSDPARLKADVFHFLIDGLDEVDFGRQEFAAQRIVEVAEANPTHSFTVASRAVPALEAFEHPDWVRVVLTPSAQWRREYLARRDVEWSELVAAVPLLDDLGDLLNLPFFLSQTVDRFNASELAETADMLSLVGRFVDAALEDVEKTLPAAAVRKWLRGLSLGMLLAGRSDLTVIEIQDSLTEELQSYGDAVSVAERLVTAPLLRATGERRYGFVHRILGEALAAEALHDLDPESSGILDVAAPAVTGRIRGLRSDWLVPITLVASAEDSWRRALAARDPLAAARPVPQDASSAERLEAARLIWNQYAEWRIWIHDYQRMSIVEDKTVLARLLATDGLGELHEEIRAAVSSDVRELIGNAIMVLADLGDRSIESQLRVVLEENPDYVLRRMAAIAARDLGLDALFYVIAHRAIHSADPTEAQDMTYAAIDLADAHELPNFALRAAEKGGEASMVLSYAIQGRMSVEAELSVLRARATHRAEPLQRERERLLALLPELQLDDHRVVESTVFVAGSWRIETDDLRSIIRGQPAPAARASVELERTRAAYIFDLDWILADIGEDDLAEAGASESLIERKRMVEEWKKRQSG